MRRSKEFVLTMDNQTKHLPQSQPRTLTCATSAERSARNNSLRRKDCLSPPGWLAALCLSLLSFGFTHQALACRVYDPGFSQYFRNSVNQDLNDFAAIHIDADDPNCAQAALYALYTKVNDALRYSGSFLGWLDGYNVALIFSATQRLGANGWASKDLDTVLVQVENKYQPTTIKPIGPCGNEGLSTCMDVDMAGATAYAWMAAYDARRMRQTNNANNADRYLHTAMADVCLFDLNAFLNSDRKTLCTGTAAGLRAGTSVAMPVNHGIENPNYGFGLMTSAASAVEGMGVAGHYFAWTQDEQSIATALFAEIQSRVSGGAYTSNCAWPQRNADGTWGGSYSAACADGSYDPNMYALYDFYFRQGLPIPNNPNYQSRSIDASKFDLGSTANDYQNGFFGLGRYVTYQTLGQTWVNQLPMMMPYNYYAPIGYLDQVDSTGVASGWSCDQDYPGGANQVDLYDSRGNVVHVRPSLGSEPAVNNLCNGGSFHRFSIQLPSYMSGSQITAYGLDYTWIGFTQLPCTLTCSW
jgi:hypothetical protein